MNEFSTKTIWTRSQEFTYEKYNRHHKIELGGQQVINNSAAKEFLGDDNMTNPEELLLSALSSCHMLTFLAVCSKSGYIVESYIDNGKAILSKNEKGLMHVSEIFLNPEVVFSGEKIPSAEALKSLHDKAHRNCFIANSILTKVTVQ